jgi:hypothetical protein
MTPEQAKALLRQPVLLERDWQRASLAMLIQIAEQGAPPASVPGPKSKPRATRKRASTRKKEGTSGSR